jgi:hypothetical protein
MIIALLRALPRSASLCAGLIILCAAREVLAQRPAPREFSVGALNRIDQLPVGRLRTHLSGLPPAPQARALQWLQSFHFTEEDLPSLHADREGGIFYVCDAVAAAPAQAEAPAIGAAAVPASPFPASLVFHSKPGAPNVLYLNFSGENVTGTEWNTSLNRTEIPAVAFSTDGDQATFSDAEQLAIKRIWQRVAEDYAPFSIDVTTERPLIFTLRTAHALITRNTDANGAGNPSSGGGGVAYINVFGSALYARYRPAWIYHNNLADTESYIAEAVSHEIGHNLGLSHDGQTGGIDYYGGHGSGDTSWGPIMGTGYNRNVSQWSKGDYHLANNTQDDLATIVAKIAYRADDHGDTPGTATALVLTGVTNVVSTTPENDPANTNTANKGVFDRGTDVDVFSFVTGSGPIDLSVRPWVMPSGARGGNFDVLLQLFNQSGTLIVSNDPASQTTAQIQTTLAAGQYYLHVRNSSTGDPFSGTPSGYTSYGSLGQFFISGYVASTAPAAPGQLAVLPASGLTSSGTVGGPFTPSSVVYTLTNSGGSSLNWTATKAQNWITLSAASGTLAPGANTTVTVSLNTGANSLAPGAYNDTVSFANTTTGNGNTSRPVALTVNSASQLAVLPASGLNSSGTVGGPFTPLSVVYALTNSGGTSLNWTATKGQSWVTLSAASGTLAPGASTTVTVSLNTGANSLPPGAYNDTVSFANTTTGNGNTSRPVALTVNSVGQLAVSPAGGLTSSGTVAGPFSPASIVYTLSNSGGSSLNWTASKAQSWVTLSAASGTLAAGASTTVTVSLNSGANSLPPGAYNDTINFANTTTGNGNTSRPVSLTVNSAGQLAVLPAGGLNSAGTVGGPFSPSSIAYTLTNSGGSSLNWTVTKGQSWVTLSAASGTLAAGASTTITVSLNAGANSLPPGAYNDTVTFANTTTGNGNTSRPVALTVNSVGQLTVSPAGGFTSSGTVGGPFSPSSIVYTLSNPGGSSLNWTATKGQSWVTLSAASGTLAAGVSTTITVSLNAGANSLPPGAYNDTVTFANTTTGNGNTSRPVALTVNSVGQLTVSPAGGFTSSGTVGGPFTPSSVVYTLTNSGGSSLNWTATKAQSWVTLSAASGTLAAGASTTVTVSLNTGANSLPPGAYNDVLSFANTTTGNGNTSRPISLTVNSAGRLAVSPAVGLNSSGTVGGPFSPSAVTYTLSNSGGSPLNWTASKTQSWVTLSATNGTLAPGASVSVGVSLNSAADALLPGIHEDTVTFENTTSGDGNASHAITLTVNPTPGELAVGPGNDFAITGVEGGPFTPGAQIYSLTNSGGSAFDWTVTTTASWLTISATQGTLAAGAATNIVVAVNENADALVPSDYSDMLDFANVTTGAGSTSRLVTLSIGATPGELAVLASTDLVASGTVGGPFSPSSTTYTLTNFGGSSLDWTIAAAADWLSVSPAAGVLAEDSSIEINVALNENANALAPGTYTNTLTITNVTTGFGNTNLFVTLTVNPPIVSLTASVNDSNWGTVNPTNATYPAGSTVEIVASPAAYYCFGEWRGDAAGTTNPLALSVNTNVAVVAVFRELLTTNNPTPFWWLAAAGHTNDFETAASSLGANGLPLWQSYIAGLDPLDPTSQLRLIANPADSAGDVLSWVTVSNRVYTISFRTNLSDSFAPLLQAFDMPSSIRRYTNSVSDMSLPRFYRLEVRQ